MFQLPHKLSELAAMALDDVVAVHKRPGFMIDMGAWCSPGVVRYPHGKNCMVCAAGAVMVQRLGYSGSRSKITNPAEIFHAFGPANGRALLAIDMLRRGNVGWALAVLTDGESAWFAGLESSDAHPLSRDLEDLSRDDTDGDGLPPLWVDAMHDLVDELVEAGL